MKTPLSRATWLLLLGCAVVALAAEGTARFALDRASAIEHRTAEEYRAARTIGAETACGRRHVLVVGNSLLDEGVRFDRVADGLAESWHARRFVVEQTFYFDWVYALKRLFREGSRPDVVVLMLDAQQWVRNGTRGDYTGQYLASWSDLPALARDLDLNATQASSLVFARASRFWGSRAEMRNFVLGHLIPDLHSLIGRVIATDPTPLTDEEVARVAPERMRRLNAIVQAHGARLVVLVPPLLDPHDGSAPLMAAAREAGASALMPVASGTFGAEMFRDGGFHLNAAGSAIFTDELVPTLRAALQAADERAVATSGASGNAAVSRPAPIGGDR